MTLITRTATQLAVRFNATLPSEQYQLVARSPIAGKAVARYSHNECRFSELRPF